MKTKTKQITAIILALCAILCLAACGDTEEPKWVLTYEKQLESFEYDNPSVIREVFYEYDTSGKMISEKLVQGSTEFISLKFVYDDEDRLTNKVGTRKDPFSLSGDLSYSHSYTYDETGNCISQFTDWGTNTVAVTNIYNEFDDVVEERSIIKDNSGIEELNYYYTLSYEDDLCVQSEVKTEEIKQNETSTSYRLIKYTYDSNGNKKKELSYYEIQSPEEAKNPILVNGKYYKLTSTTEYTYELLDDVAIASETSSNPTNTPSESQTDATQNTDKITSTEAENSQVSSNIEESKENYTTQTQPSTNQSKPTSDTSQPTHTHSYSNATCTSPKKCSCGATSGTMLGHSYSDANCTAPKKCTRCGATAGIALGHQFSSASCTSPQICNRCGTTSGNALGHNYSAANCNSPKTCTRCSQIEGSALGHNYVNNKCSRCGKVDPDSLPVGLEQLHVIDSNSDYYSFKSETIEDTFGNKYVGYHRFKEVGETAYAIFNLNYKYSKFSCDIITTCKDATFSIYVDNVLKYQTTNLSNVSGPIHVDVDVKNGQQLKIVATDNNYSWSVAGCLVNAQLTK